ncbi:uncharacterized protein LOC118761746, partial [Octopus sinensis]|uniref:Uncharacterized protein LOC118761746 n=1 Tax=Octopus sinensis TaxID=2607531 RepID=A0A7E6ELU4_9MOLL
APKFEDRCVQREATCQELGAASQAIVNRTFEVKETQTLAEPVVNRTFEVKETQTLAEPVVNRTFEVKETQTLAEPVVRPKFKEKASQRVAEPVVRPKFKRKASQRVAEPVGIQLPRKQHLMNVAEELVDDWFLAGILLEIKSTKLYILNRNIRNDVVKRNYEMLCEWFMTCDPKRCTFDTLKDVLKEIDCYGALECLPRGVIK